MRSLSLFLTVVLFVSLAACSRQVWTTSNVSSYVSQELPNGSDRKQVTSFLDRRNIEHTDSAQDVVAIFRNKPSNPSHSDVKVTFHFGADGKLASEQSVPILPGQ